MEKKTEKCKVRYKNKECQVCICATRKDKEHRSQSIADKCSVCWAPLCRDCIERWEERYGYVCNGKCVCPACIIETL